MNHEDRALPAPAVSRGGGGPSGQLPHRSAAPAGLIPTGGEYEVLCHRNSKCQNASGGVLVYVELPPIAARERILLLRRTGMGRW